MTILALRTLMSHPSYTLLFAALLAFAIALTGKQDRRERVYHGVWIFSLFITSTVAGGWAMYFIHG